MTNRLVTVATFHDTVAAALAKNLLENEGIPACLMDEATVATDWMLSGAIGGIKLQVDPLHVERAEMLLARLHDNEEAPPDEPPMPSTAIATKETVDELAEERDDKLPINKLADQLFRTAVFSLLFLPLQLYVLYLLASLYASEGKVSPKRRWKVWVSVLLNIPLMSVVAIPLVWLTAALTAGPGSPEHPVWRRHYLHEHGFTVRLPHEPYRHTYVTTKDEVTTRSKMFDAWSHQRSFRVAITPVTNAPGDMPVEKWLQNDAAETVKSVNGNMLSETAVDLKGLPGRDYVYAYGMTQARRRTFLRDGILFDLMLISSRPDCVDEEAEQFFKSFRFLEP